MKILFCFTPRINRHARGQQRQRTEQEQQPKRDRSVGKIRQIFSQWTVDLAPHLPIRSKGLQARSR